MSVLKTLVSSSRAFITSAKDIARFREIASVFVTHGFGWFIAQLKLRRELRVKPTGKEQVQPVWSHPDTGKRLVEAFTKLGPTFIKFGQILSTRPDLLPKAITDELTRLQDDVKPLSFTQIEAQLQKNLGLDFRKHLGKLEETPLASASIAQVHRATLIDGSEVVFKVQRPGLKPKIDSDLNILLGIAGYIEEAFEEAAAMDLRGIIADFAKSLMQEMDFRIEARNIERFLHNFANDAKIQVPKVYLQLSTSEVLCMEFIDGRKFSDLLASGEDLAPLVRRYFNATFKMLFVDGFFHGDLHPGNVLVRKDGSLVLIDCGMVGRLSRPLRDKLIDVIYAMLNEDLEAVARTLYSIAIRKHHVHYQSFEADVIEIGERYLGGIPLSEIQIGAFFSDLVAGAARHRVRMPSDFTMMFKAIVTTEGLAKSIAPNIDPIELARPFIMEMVKERYSPERLKQVIISDFNMLSSSFRALPQLVCAVLSDLQEGKVSLRVAPETLRLQAKAADRRNRRSLRIGLAMTCLLCGTYTLSLNLPGFTYLGIPYIAAIFFAFALYGVLTLLRH